MKRVAGFFASLFLFVSFTLCCYTSIGQTTQTMIINPSFEVNPCTACSNCTAPGWTGCAATPDVLNGDGSIWCVNTPPQDGCTYAGIAQGEYIGQQLACPFIAGRTYNMTVWLAYDNDYASTVAAGACVKDRTAPGNLQIYGGATSCAATQLLWSSGVLTGAADTWKQFSISITPTANCNYIMFKNDVASANVLIDNFQLLNTNTSTTVTHSACTGATNDGSATVIPPNNGTNWNILWSDGQTTPTATGLSGGTYTVKLTDADGFCTAPITMTVVIKGPPNIAVTASPTSICSGTETSQLNATVVLPPPVPCIYTLNMFDSFGDGWGAGASVVVRVNGTPVGTYTLASGSVGSATFSVFTGDNIQITYTRPGSFSSEVSFELRDASNGLAYTSGSNPTNGVKWTGTANCGGSSGVTYTYNWGPTTGLSNPNIANPIASPTSATTTTVTYIVTVTASDNPTCKAQLPVAITVKNCTVVPLELLSFNAKATDNYQVLLDWTTASENNTEAFEILRSANGLAFESIGKVAAAGNSKQKLNYSFTDKTLPLYSKIIYYRLKQVDFNGDSKLSHISSINLVSKLFSKLSVQPQPAREYADIRFVAGETAAGEAISVNIYNIYGQMVQHILPEQQVSEGLNSIRLPLDKLSKGTYILELDLGNDSERTKLIVD